MKHREAKELAQGPTAYRYGESLDLNPGGPTPDSTLITTTHLTSHIRHLFGVCFGFVHNFLCTRFFFPAFRKFYFTFWNFSNMNEGKENDVMSFHGPVTHPQYLGPNLLPLQSSLSFSLFVPLM